MEHKLLVSFGIRAVFVDKDIKYKVYGFNESHHILSSLSKNLFELASFPPYALSSVMALADEKDNDNQNSSVWPSGLLLNSAYAMTFACIKCNDIPKHCYSDENGGILCGDCSKDMNGIILNKAVQSMISKLKVKCITLPDSVDSGEVEGGGVVITHARDNQCDWTGAIQEIEEHTKVCDYVIIRCDKCRIFKATRKEIARHMEECGDVTIDCPLKCGMLIILYLLYMFEGQNVYFTFYILHTISYTNIYDDK